MRLSEDKTWCDLRGQAVALTECATGCPAPEHRVVCAMDRKDPLVTSPSLAHAGGGGGAVGNPVAEALPSLADKAHEARRAIDVNATDVLCHFRVDGKPIPKGSMRATHDQYGDVHLYDGNRELPVWHQAIHWSARQAMGRRSPSSNPIEIVIEFVVPTPKRREGELWPIQKGTGDLDKLIRAMLDGMNGIVYVDDAQVVRIVTSKRYSTSGRSPGATVWAYAIPSI